MQQSKIELTERLRRENRWSEASRFKDEAITRLRTEENLSREDAKERAWQLMAEHFPPAPIPEAEEEVVSVRVQGLGQIPPSWPKLSANAPLHLELAWVQSNRLRVVEERSLGVTVVHLDRAGEPPPSRATLAWLETSIRSYAKFVDVISRHLKDEPNEQQLVRRERMQLDEMRGMLEEMQDQWAEELLANTPETTRVKVRSLLDDWARRSGLTIPQDAKANLAGHVCELVDECVGILAPAAGSG